jgi:ATP-dependent Lon protease
MMDDSDLLHASEGASENGGSSLVLPDQVLPPNLFVMPYAGQLIFPTLMAPMPIGHTRYVSTVEESISRQRYLGLLLTRESEIHENLKPEDLYEVGVIVKVLKRIKLTDGSISILVHSLKRFRAKRFLSQDPYLVAEVEYLEDPTMKSEPKDSEIEALTRAVVSQVKDLSRGHSYFSDDMKLAMVNAPNASVVADIVAFALNLPKKEAQDFLETLSVKERFQKLLVHLKREKDVTDLQRKITDDVNSKLNQLQREFFLKEQLKVIKRELGLEEDGKDLNSRSFRERIEAAQMPEEVKKVALDEVRKFEALSESSPEYNVSRNYLEHLVGLPWSVETQDQLELKQTHAILEEEHYGLKKVKERILEALAVRKLKQDTKGLILCLVGPPGVGKTSIGKAIARSMGRNFFRFSLGGMRDEAEIKGHRRTYVGAMPGKFIQGIKRAGSKNCVIMLDEIDKIGASYQGDPASALLEVLDPEQNHSFLDHYLDVPFDLSKVLFIATANTLSTIPAPLLDRMEIIELSGYTLEEKEVIAQTHVIPKELEKAGLKVGQVHFTRVALRRMMQDYAREPGLRTLQKLISQILRKIATELIQDEESGLKSARRRKWTLKADDLEKYLGPKRFTNEMVERMTHPGVVTGLAWTAMGGDVLFIEAIDTPGTGQLKLTGQMGEVMTESASIAWSYVKRRLGQEFGWGQDRFKDRDIHLHIPAGAIPKDGPSAGVTMATALYSLMTGRKARAKLAMTGELSLIGKVLPVGGIKEKVLAARRSGVQEILIPKQNERDLKEIPEEVLKELEIRLVANMDEVLEWTLKPKLPSRAVKVLVKSVGSRGARVLDTQSR